MVLFTKQSVRLSLKCHPLHQRNILGIEIQLESKVLKALVAKGGRKDLLGSGGLGVSKDGNVLLVVGSGADVELVEAKVAGLEVHELVVVGLVEGLGGVALNRKVQGAHALHGHVVQLGADARQQIRTTDVGLRLAALGDEDGLVIDVDGEGLGVASFVKLLNKGVVR